MTEAIYISNDNLLTLDNLINSATGQAVNSATVQATLVDEDGTQVAGQSWPVSMPYVSGSSGKYQGSLESALVLTDAGAAVLAFSNAGALAGEGALAGVANLTLLNAGDLEGRGDLSGVAALLFVNAGAIDANGSLAGFASLAFSNSGDLDGDGLRGSVALAFSNVGDLLAEGSLVGSADMVFINAGALSEEDILGFLTGTLSIEPLLSATLRAMPSIDGKVTLN